MDAFAVSICKGLAAGKVTKKEYLACGVWFGAFQAIMPFAGYMVGANFEKYITMIAPWVAFGLLTLIGGNMIREALAPDEEVTPGFDIKTMFMMAVATSIDALAVGITFVAVPVKVLGSGRLPNVVFAVAVIGIITFIISTAGVKIGSVFIFGMLIPLIGTLLGSAVIYAKKSRVTEDVRMVLVGSGSGIMLSIAVWGMIEPSIDGLGEANVKGIIPVTICFFAGVILQVILDKIIPHTHVYSEITEGPRSRLDPEIKVMLTEVIHHIPEGIALGAIYAAHFMKTEWISSSVAIVLAIAIAFQNIPEAIYVSLPIGEKGSNAGKAFFMGVVSGVPIPLLGVITIVLVVLFPGMLPYIMAVAGGALIFTTIEEIPHIASERDNDKGTLAFTVGFALVMLMIFLM